MLLCSCRILGSPASGPFGVVDVEPDDELLSWTAESSVVMSVLYADTKLCTFASAPDVLRATVTVTGPLPDACADCRFNVTPGSALVIVLELLYWTFD